MGVMSLNIRCTHECYAGRCELPDGHAGYHYAGSIWWPTRTGAFAELTEQQEHQAYARGVMAVKALGRSLIRLGAVLARDEHAELEATRRWLRWMAFDLDDPSSGARNAARRMVAKTRKATARWRRTP